MLPHREIEPKWQKYWEENQTFSTPEDFDKPKYYVLDMFPYPSGAGLHVGHPEGYTATDIVARYKRMQGFCVLHTMGWDAFGLPAERYAMQTGVHPAKTTQTNIDNFRRQLKSLGFSYDWGREINTTSPDYYKWTQWIFLKLFNSWFDEVQNRARPIEELPLPENLKNLKTGSDQEKIDYINSKRLAYVAEMPVNWCAELGTVLANEEVDEWVEKGYQVERRPMRQWMLRITAYADRLLKDLDLVDWPSGTLAMQKEWIGKSRGAEIDFAVEIEGKGESEKITVYSTRPDTIYGATFMSLAPEHPLVKKVTRPECLDAVEKYTKEASLKSERDRQIEKSKSGVFTGAYASHPLEKNRRLPIWIADYVLMGYGHGAVMGVPAHDERDFEFAQKYNQEIIPVISVVSKGAKKGKLNEDLIPPSKTELVYEGIAINSPLINGLKTQEAKSSIIEHLEKEGIGREKVNFKIRDWLFSRQRYWGEPIPISFDSAGNFVPFEENKSDENQTPTKKNENASLPLELPPSDDFHPSSDGHSPLARIENWVEYEAGGEKFRRETNTMPQWAGSCWYYLRFIDPENGGALVGKEKEAYWMEGGIDLYVGGAEHAVLHLLYARFWHKFLYDLGVVSSKEPFRKLVHQGIILGEDGHKMSKSRGNVVNPDGVVEKFGADAFRLYQMFMGPLDQMKPWSSKAIQGVYRFLNKVYATFVKDEGEKRFINEEIFRESGEEGLTRLIHKTIDKVTKDIESLSFNTAIAQLMIFMNEAVKNEGGKKNIGKKNTEAFILLLSPFAPHLAEELWQLMGHQESLSYQKWPQADPNYLADEQKEIVFQINSKVRSKIMFPIEIANDEEELEKSALKDPAIQKHLEGKKIRKIIVVKGKLVNFVV